MKKSIFAAIAAIGLTGAANAREVPEPETNTVHTYILLDRTGSMEGIWTEALASVNAYASAAADESDGAEVDVRITLATFDEHQGFQFDVLRRDETADSWSAVTNAEASPRGMTPLFDAIGRITAVAEGDDPEKAVIVVMTDGKENASTDYTRETARKALDRAEERGWQVVFLGADFGNFADADAVGVSRSKQMAISPESLEDSLRVTGQKVRDYGSGAAEEVEYDEADRELANEEEVKNRSNNQR